MTGTTTKLDKFFMVTECGTGILEQELNRIRSDGWMFVQMHMDQHNARVVWYRHPPVRTACEDSFIDLPVTIPLGFKVL